MKKLAIQWLTLFSPRLIVMGLLFLLLCAPYAEGQEEDGTLADKIIDIVETSQEIHEIFKEIVETLENDALEGARTPGLDIIDSYVNNSEGTFEDIIEMVPNITKIFKLFDSFPFGGLDPDTDTTGLTIPDFRNSLTRLLGFINQPLLDLKQLVSELRDDLNSSLAQTKANLKYKYYSPSSDSLPFPNADTLYFWGNVIRDFWGDPAVVLTVAEINDLVQGLGNFIKDEGKQTFSITLGISGFGFGLTLGVGGNISGLTAIYNFVSILSAMLNTAVQNVASNTTATEVNASYLRLGHIHYDIDIVQDSLDSHIADFQVWKELSIRTRIEINLGGHGTHPHPIAIFQLPTQFGGYLELARDIVQSAINNMLAAGENVYQAEMFLSRGNSEYAASHWKKAYEWYSKSYDEATK